MKKIINPWRNHEGYNCFGCSPDNPIGLHLEFYEDGDYIVSTWHPGHNYQGWVDTMHGGGAAYIAYRKFGAIMGQGVGLQGQSYAIPTMQGGVETIRPYVDEFIAFANIN